MHETLVYWSVNLFSSLENKIYAINLQLLTLWHHIHKNIWFQKQICWQTYAKLLQTSNACK